MSFEDFLAANAESRAFSAGALIVAEGAQAEAAFVVREGHVTVFRTLPDGREAVVARLGPGAIFGEMALLRYDTYTLSVRAEVEAVLYVISPALLHEQIRQTPPLIRAILDMALDRINETNEALIDIGTLQE